MTQFTFSINDYVTVTLTKEGADHLVMKRREFYDAYPMLERRDYNYIEGQIYKAQFWTLFEDFHEMLYIGCRSPFVMGDIQVESSLES